MINFFCTNALRLQHAGLTEQKVSESNSRHLSRFQLDFLQKRFCLSSVSPYFIVCFEFFQKCCTL